MTSTVTTGSALVLAGDFSKYVIVDHMGGPSLEYVENVVDGSGIPTGGTRGWIFWNRGRGLPDTHGSGCSSCKPTSVGASWIAPRLDHLEDS